MGRFGDNRKVIDILLVEDSPSDAELLIEALSEAKVRNKLIIARDGVEALDILYKRGDYEDAQTPDIILLDLNLPKKDGREVLAELKKDENLKHIPVVVLTSSEAEEDVLNTYRLSANCFITKPLDLNQFIKIIKVLEGFWLEVVKLPPKSF